MLGRSRLRGRLVIVGLPDNRAVALDNVELARRMLLVRLASGGGGGVVLSLAATAEFVA